MQTITAGQFELVANSFSFAIAAMGAATIFLWLSRSQVGPNYKTTLTISGLVTAIATYHYFRIFNSWHDAYTVTDGVVTATGIAFNSAYRYVDWLLTVPLLLVELIFVMRLPEEETAARATRLGLAAALMIVLGYPGEIAADNVTKAVWGTLSSLPFLYIVWSLFRGLGESIGRQPENVRGLVRSARLLTFASWGFYPLVYMVPYTGATGDGVTATIQLGYTLADLVSKAVFGVLIYNIALRKSAAEAADGSTAHT